MHTEISVYVDTFLATTNKKTKIKKSLQIKMRLSPPMRRCTFNTTWDVIKRESNAARITLAIEGLLTVDYLKWLDVVVSNRLSADWR